MLSHRKGILLDGIGSELVRASSGGVRKTLSKWLGDLSAAITLGDVASVFTSGDATPSVLNNSKFITDGATAITNFDDGVEGQTITIYRGASDIVITDNATIDTIIAGNLSLTAARPSATFRLASGVWKQVEEAGAVATTFLAVMQAATVALSRIALGFPAALDALWTAATVGAARIALGFAAALDTLWTASSLVAAIRALGQAPSVEAYGAVGDLRDVYDAGITSGLAVLTSATLDATSAFVGKTVVIQGAGAVQLFSIRKPLVATILSLNSATSVNLSATASATVSNANAAIGTDNTTFFQNAINSGYKKILAYGHYLIAGTLTFPLDNFHFQGAGGIIDRQSLNYGNGSTATTGMDAALPKVGTRLLWAGTFGNPVTLFAPSSALGFERKHFGNGLRDMVIDCAGQTCTGVAVRGQQSMEFWNVSVVRFQRNLAVGTQYTTSQYDGAWDIGAAYGSSLTFWDQRGFRARGLFAINRGTPYAGAVGLWAHGDKIKGNVNYLDIEGDILIEDVGSAEAMHIESVDTSDLSRLRWNGTAHFHAADTGFRSTLNGNTTAANDSTHPASQARTVHCSKGGYAKYWGTTYTDGVTAARFFASRGHTMIVASAENIGVPPNIHTNAQCAVIYEGTGTDERAIFYGMAHPDTFVFKASQILASGAIDAPTALTWSDVSSASRDPLDGFSSGANTRLTRPVGHGITQSKLKFKLVWPADTATPTAEATLINELRRHAYNHVMGDPGLVIGSGATTSYRHGATVSYLAGGIFGSTGAAADHAFTSAHVVTANLWGVFLVTLSAGGTWKTTVPSATQAYASEALAIAAMPAPPASESVIGYITIRARSSVDFTGNTTTLTADDGVGNSQTVNYYDGGFDDLPNSAAVVATHKRRVYVRINGTDIIDVETRTASDGDEWGYETRWVDFDATDYWEVLAAQNGSGSETLDVSDRSWVQATWR